MHGQQNVKKSKDNVHPRTGHEDPEREQRYSFNLSWTSALDGMGGQRHTPCRFTPGKDPVPNV